MLGKIFERICVDLLFLFLYRSFVDLIITIIKTMKKLAFFILLSLVTLGVSAQSNLKWNVNAGIGMSNWYGCLLYTSQIIKCWDMS